ncbi:MAG: glycine--tRNA ligase subunit beta [Gammaproteobacteria bacterium]|nr:glycine--tRNA ligase subunit beta [Gammaproteobacteria bacterium]
MSEYGIKPCTFLVEIGTEELPPKALRALSAAFTAGVHKGLQDALLTHGEVQSYATPRRLAVKVLALQTQQADQEIVLKGPPVKVAFDAQGNPGRAAISFAEKCGVQVQDLEQEDTPKGAWLVYRGIEKGRAASSLLGPIVQAALDALPIPKRMRWGAGKAEFVRPVHWVVMLLDSEIVDATILGIGADRLTRGHRFHAPGNISLAGADEYPRRLESEGHLIAEFDTRRKKIERLVQEEATAVGATVVSDDALWDEVAALVEWPVSLRGRIDQRFLALPREVLIATMQEHQRYFPLEGPDGKLLPIFVAISNLQSQDPAQVIQGNERVVRPRLADAEFFWNKDRKQSLAQRQEGLASVVFQHQLGSMREKSQRVAVLAAYIADELQVDRDLVTRAALLSKCDLATNMVSEFPELQGTMGHYYALADGETPEVAAAMEEQYQPRFAGDALPAGRVGQVLAIADRLDTLGGIFSIGQKPSGSRDPFGLRRGALGLMRIIIEHGLDLDLRHAIDKMLSLQPVGTLEAGLAAEVYQYAMERLRAYYLEEAGGGFTGDMFEAVLARQPGKPLDFHQRLTAVRVFTQMPEAQSLAAANKRVSNILRKAEEPVSGAVRPDLLVQPEELALHREVQRLGGLVEPLLLNRQYTDALTTLAALREPVDNFFDRVMVMDPDPALRANRLALLESMRRLFLFTADLSLLKVNE